MYLLPDRVPLLSIEAYSNLAETSVLSCSAAWGAIKEADSVSARDAYSTVKALEAASSLSSLLG